MTAYEVIPVGAAGLEEHRALQIDIATYRELLAQNEVLRRERDEARLDADQWHNAWVCARNNRAIDRERLARAMRVLASLGRLAPRMAGVVEAARREVWGELP